MSRNASENKHESFNDFELRTITYITSFIKPLDKPDTKYKLDIDNFMFALNIKSIEELKEVLKSIADNGKIVRAGDNTLHYGSIFKDVRIGKRYITIQLSELWPYFFY